MKTIDVKTGRPYQIHIGHGLLSRFPELFAEVYGQRRPKLAVITDDRVNGLGHPGEALGPVPALEAGLQAAGYETCKFIFPNGEPSKNLDTVRQVYRFLSENGITRTDVVIAVGGGVVGDLAGFAAASWLRGIDFVQVPTTLLAMVDSSVGGKTGVDIPEGKNLVGAFWQPALVVCDTAMLSFLPEEIFSDGMAEVVKYGAILDGDLFALLEHGEIDKRIAEIVARCVTLKRDVVESDERDKGLRQILNFGHTFGHAIEKESHFTITHGQGVAIGMVLIAQVCEKAGITPPGTADKLARCCKIYGLPTANPYPVETLCGHARGDKKRAGNKITLITLDRIGKAALHPVPVEKLEAFMRGDLHG
ncbi:3-dehydroquinate synthase [Anaerotruncus rubiinfantis]|uniref:3-dehydroquinate synthase n=1 Tax=Anaerotruncus rubiinfantis TaxID=1720200 RepID=UPI000836E8FB|nr:3-dehydroquinate synthase [Anaerotruncus rubiinfantis]